MFLGSNGTFNLDQLLTRVEGVTMIVRLLGKDAVAKEKNLSHPFSDVPSWADPYVGYCYTEKISNGISASEFGSNQAMSAAQYLTLVLRALGYKDGAGKDFLWNEAPSKALEIGLIGEPCYQEYTTTNQFLRDNAAMIAFSALSLNKKDTGKTLESTITMPGRPTGTMPSHTKSATVASGSDKQKTNTVSTPEINEVILKNGHDGGNLLIHYQYTGGFMVGAERYATLYTGNYSGPLKITFNPSNDTRDITVEAHSTYAITYTYSVTQDKGTVIQNPDTTIMTGIDPVTKLPRYTRIPGTTTTIPAISRQIQLDVVVSGAVSAEVSTTIDFAGTYGKGDFKMVKIK